MPPELENTRVFSDFCILKIKLIRLDFSFQKINKIPRIAFEPPSPQPTDSQSGVITTTPQSQL